jgi:hypothetical protein
MKRVVTALLLGASLCGTAIGQVEPPKGQPSRGGSAGVGFGIQVDLGSLVSRVAALFGHATSDTASNVVAGQVVAVWAEDEVALAPEEVARAMQARVLADHPLSSLGLRLVLFAVDEEEADKLLAQARQSFPQISFARNRYVDTLQTEHTAASPGAAGRQYAHELVGATAVQRLPQPVRIGVIDGAPDANAPLDAASFDLQPFTDAGHSPHASAIACELACRPETGFSGLARGAELVWAAILSPHSNGHERSDLVTLARALDGLVKRRAEVILTSLGTPPNPVLTRVLDRVLPKVRAFVAAAGNGGPNGTVPLPAAHPGVVAVAAVDAAAQPWPQGSRGQAILVAAPGVDLWLPVGGGRYFTGTSYAAPFAAAWIAQRLARGQPADAAALCATAQDLPPAGRDDATGCGLLRWSP